ncbi:MAG: hypothetical protein R3F59_38635 [Myxococcota bacterium]
MILPLVLAACTPPALDLPLAWGRDRHWSDGDVYRLDDGACTAMGPDVDGTAQVVVDNAYLETVVVGVSVDADCEPLEAVEVAPGEDGVLVVAVPGVVRIETLEGEVLSTWGVFFPNGAGAVHVQP